jgi:hypothetical protein
MATDRQPVWWLLYTLVPLMGGLLVLEHEVSLSPPGHKFMQIGIVVGIYGLVWLWLRANMLVLLRAAYNAHGKTYAETTYADEAHRAARPLRPPLAPRRAYVRKATARRTMGYIEAPAYRMEISKCSLN